MFRVRVFYTCFGTMVPYEKNVYTDIARFYLRGLNLHEVQFVDDCTYQVSVVVHEGLDIKFQPSSRCMIRIVRELIRADSVKILINLVANSQLCPNAYGEVSPDIVISATEPRERYPTATHVSCPPWFYNYYDQLTRRECIMELNGRVKQMDLERMFTVVSASHAKEVSVVHRLRGLFPCTVVGDLEGSLRNSTRTAQGLETSVKMLRQYAFFVCTDSTQLFMASCAGCIPIYLVDDHYTTSDAELAVFNQNRILFVDTRRVSDLQAIMSIYRQNLSLVVDHLKEAPFTTDCAEGCVRKYEAVTATIAEVILSKAMTVAEPVSLAEPLGLAEPLSLAEPVSMAEPLGPALPQPQHIPLPRIYYCISAPDSVIHETVRDNVILYKREGLVGDEYQGVRILSPPSDCKDELTEHIDDTTVFSLLLEHQTPDIHSHDILLYTDPTGITPATVRSIQQNADALVDLMRYYQQPVSFVGENENLCAIAFHKSAVVSTSIETLWLRRDVYLRFPFLV